MQYRILKSDCVVELQSAVQRHLDVGWELQGGVSVAVYCYPAEGSAEVDWLYCQAIYRSAR